LEGDTNKAAEKAHLAITDMSDNANKMGTDMSMIQNAYQGFAKANYTMLDNLKLGYGGTKEEMQRLLEDAEKLSGQKFDLSSYADIVDGIHVIQTEMGITGTTAKEASTTISGSISSMKASWQNLLTAISADDLPFETYVNNFVDSVATVANNLMPRIEIALNGVVQLIDKLAPVIMGKIPELLNTLLPAMVEGATNLVNSLVGIFPSLVSTATSMLPELASSFTI
jgi:phage-related protein